MIADEIRGVSESVHTSIMSFDQSLGIAKMGRSSASSCETCKSADLLHSHALSVCHKPDDTTQPSARFSNQNIQNPKIYEEDHLISLNPAQHYRCTPSASFPTSTPTSPSTSFARTTPHPTPAPVNEVELPSRETRTHSCTHTRELCVPNFR